MMMKIIPYYVIVNLEAFILCFSGEYLSSKVRKREEKYLHRIFNDKYKLDNQFRNRVHVKKIRNEEPIYIEEINIKLSHLMNCCIYCANFLSIVKILFFSLS